MLDKSKLSLIVTEVLIERIPVLKSFWAILDGHKTTIGRVLLAVVAILDTLQSVYPEWVVLGSVHAGTLTIVSWFFVEFGLRHKALKVEKEVITLE